MEIILKQDVKNLGYKDDLIKVKNGYGLNFIIPRGFGILATDQMKKVRLENIKQKAYKEQKIEKSANELCELLKNISVKVMAKAGDQGKIFGSVTTLQLADAIKKLGYEVDRKNITINDEPIKNLGKYTANVRLHKNIAVDVNFEVVEE
jgi:large subunit ribosomal protein L9